MTSGAHGSPPAHAVNGRLGSPAHARWLERHTDGLLDFARGAVVPEGFGYLDAAGRVVPDRPVELWITCRMTYAFALGTLLGRAGCAPLVDHGLDALHTCFADPVHGGWWAAVGPDGPTSTAKEAYAHAFVLLAAATAVAADRPGAAELLADALELSTARFWSEAEGMVLESWDEAFTTPEAYRGVNANMHTVEAYLAVADVTGRTVWRDRALRILDRVLRVAREHHWRIPEHFTPSWEPVLDYNDDDRAHPFRPYGATVGHWFEWARLALHARAAVLAPDDDVAAPPGEDRTAWLLDSAVALFDAGVREGWAVDGADGFVYTVDVDGVPVVHERMHWVVTEAIGAAAVLARTTGDPRYARWYDRWWGHAATHFLDGTGSWVHELDARHRPSATVWPGKPDVYHAIQATLLPRLPVWPTIGAALREGLLDGTRTA